MTNNLDFSRLKTAGNTQKRDRCQKGYSCGSTCISRTHACNRRILPSAKAYADYLKQHGDRANNKSYDDWVNEKLMHRSPRKTLPHPDPTTSSEFVANGRILGDEVLRVAREADNRLEGDRKRLSEDWANWYISRQRELEATIPEIQDLRQKRLKISNEMAGVLAGNSASDPLELRKKELNEYNKLSKENEDLFEKLIKVSAPSQERAMQEAAVHFKDRQDAIAAKEKQYLIAVEAFRQKLINNSPVSKEMAAQMAGTIRLPFWGKKKYPAIKEDMAEFYQITGGMGFSKTFRVAEISSATDKRAYAELDGTFGVTAKDKGSTFHEMAHFIEIEDESIGMASKEWVETKSGDASPRKLKDLTGLDYDDREIAEPDHFVDPYVGKVCDGSLSEVISVGLEHFVDARSLLKLATKDPDHFAYIMGVIRNPSRTGRG